METNPTFWPAAPSARGVVAKGGGGMAAAPMRDHPAAVRPVLGEISTNTVASRLRTQQNLKRTQPPPQVQKQQQGFTIFQDFPPAESKALPPPPSSSTSSHPAGAAPSSAFPFKIHCDDDLGGCSSRQIENRPPPPPYPHGTSRIPSEGFWADKVAKLPFAIHRDQEEHKAAPADEAMAMGEPTKEHQRVPLGELAKDNSSHLPVERSRSCSQDDSSSMSSSEESPMVMDVSCRGEEEMEEKVVASVMQKEEIAMLDMEEYQDDIYSYLKECQSKHIPKWNYMTKQPDITFSMRSILVDWLVEVAEEYKLQNETVYLAVNYIDRFLSFMSVQRAKLQLVGTACMFIAAKYEEIYPPDVGEFVYITDDTYSKKQVLRMEQLVLKVLNFDLAVPTTLLFVTQFSKISQSDDEAVSLAQYLSELSLLDAETYLPYTSSEVAAASVALARHTLGMAAWPEDVVRMSGLAVDDFKECLVHLHGTFTSAPEHAQQAMKEKYKQPRFHGVSEIAPTPIF